MAVQQPVRECALKNQMWLQEGGYVYWVWDADANDLNAKIAAFLLFVMMLRDWAIRERLALRRYEYLKRTECS